jgi:hypothetical protein
MKKDLELGSKVPLLLKKWTTLVLTSTFMGENAF